MFGVNHSVSTLLGDEMPYLLTVKCSCHTIHLVASYAAKCLPAELEDGLRAIYNHFSHSTARRRDFTAFQVMEHQAKLKILSPGQTRWLSLEACVWRIKEQLNPLKAYFAEEYKDGKLASIKAVVDLLNHELTFPFLHFVAYALNQLNEINTQFQSESPQIHELKSEIHRLIKSFAKNFMNLRYVRGNESDPMKIDPLLTSQYVELNKIYLGKLQQKFIIFVLLDLTIILFNSIRSTYR